jgi:dachs protein
MQPGNYQSVNESHALLVISEDASGEVVLLKGETVLVVGASQRRGHLVVEHNNVSLHVPFQFLELKPVGVNI